MTQLDNNSLREELSARYGLDPQMVANLLEAQRRYKTELGKEMTFEQVMALELDAPPPEQR